MGSNPTTASTHALGEFQNMTVAFMSKQQLELWTSLLTLEFDQTFSVNAGPWKGCALSPILLVVFMCRLSRCSRGEDHVLFGSLRIAPLLFAVMWSLWLCQCDLIALKSGEDKST